MARLIANNSVYQLSNYFSYAVPFFLIPLSLLVLSYPPTIPSQGVAHRIFYFHVPIAWVALYAPLLSAGSALLYLFTRKESYDIWSLASSRIAYLFAIAVLISGPLWAETEWGVYWNWKDSRLISFFILFLTLSTYFLVRLFSQNPASEKSSAAVLAILAAIAAVLTWFAIRLIEPDTHPPSILNKMSPKISQSFWLSVLVYHLFFWALLHLSIYHEKIIRLCAKYSSNERSS